jgi:Na+/H+-dicarboxylate symporter
MIGLVLGIATGVFFGERATAVDIVGEAFVRLLQMSVIPYVAISLIAGIAQLDAQTARHLALRGGSAMLVLWGITLAAVSLFPVAFPEMQTASFFSTAMVTQPAEVNLLSLYIPANPFDALVNGIMPAIVLFSLCVGVALISIPNRQPLVNGLRILSDALMKLNAFVVGLAPYGVFALMAGAAGTMTVDEISRLQVFVLTFAGMSVLLALWVLPAFVAALTPLRYRQVIATSRDALVTAFATGSLLVVLPILAADSRRLSVLDDSRSPEDISPAEVIVPVSFNFPSAGKLLYLSFIGFAGWFSGNNLTLNDLPTLLSVGTFTFFGPNAMAIPFMLDFFHLPSDLFEIFLAVDVLTGRFSVLVAAMHVLSVAVLTGFAMEKNLEVDWLRLGRWAVISIAGLVALLVGARFYFDYAIDTESKGYQIFVEMELVEVPVRVLDEAPPLGGGSSRGTLFEIEQSGVLRVCYPGHSLPLAFVNEQNQLVGFDIDSMHSLAHTLEVDLYLHRSTRADIVKMLDSGRCHIAVGGIAMTPRRVRQMSFTRPYLNNTIAFVMRDYDRHGWASWDQVREMKAPRIAIGDSPHYLHLMERKLPNAEFVTIASPRDFFRGKLDDVDAFVYGAEVAGAWTLVYPSFAVVVPKPDPIGVPLSYAIRRGEWEWSSYLDVWIELRQHDGSLDGLFKHWILGESAGKRGPRWSVIRNVLGWVD